MAGIIRRFKERRHDKIKLWIGLLIGAALPILVCWTMPNLWASWREYTAAHKAQAAQRAQEVFVTEYADLITLCDREDDQIGVSVSMPAAPRVVVIQHGRQAAVQEHMPDAWSPDDPADVSVVVCLGREKVQPVGSCEDGTLPDISAYEGYELARWAEISSTPGMLLPGGCQHPELSGMVLYRYATSVSVYEVSSGQLIALAALWGGEPGVCVTPDKSMSPERALYGPRITDSALLEGIMEILGS